MINAALFPTPLKPNPFRKLGVKRMLDSSTSGDSEKYYKAKLTWACLWNSMTSPGRTYPIPGSNQTRSPLSNSENILGSNHTFSLKIV